MLRTKLAWAVVVALGCGCSASGSPKAPESAPGATGASEAPHETPSTSPTDGVDSAGSREPGPTAAPTAAPPVEEKALGGSLTQNEIRDIVEKHGEYFNDCYSIGAGKSQQFVAQVTLKVTLGPSGTVNEARVTKSTAKNPKVDQCVVDGFKKIKFPPPKAGATSVFTFPMNFNGAVEEQR